MTDQVIALTRLLDSFRTYARSKREQGRYFENLALIYFRHDAKQRNCYEQVWTYEDWARERGENAQEPGIDLVAQLRGGGGLCAIQAKFFEPGRRLTRSTSGLLCSILQGDDLPFSESSMNSIFDGAEMTLDHAYSFLPFGDFSDEPSDFEKMPFGTFGEFLTRIFHQFPEFRARDAVSGACSRAEA